MMVSREDPELIVGSEPGVKTWYSSHFQSFVFAVCEQKNPHTEVIGDGA
jgi:hypothetical protein